MDAPARHIATGRRVIAEEAEALQALAEAIDGGFGAALDTILGATGRVIVSGMGKSGHVARKIAATLASTGTPAHFVHPAEASHGDLGMISAGDVVMVLSNSGETPELVDLVAHAKRHAIPLIAMTCRPGSTVTRRADVTLLLPKRAEACGHDVVPTTSTTMMLALGDALAVALMEARAFSPTDFRAFHPGGKLGARLSRVADLMHRDDEVPLASARTPMSDALLTMTQKGFGILGVLDDDRRLAGAITDGDLRRHMAGLLSHAAGEVMTRDPLTIGPDALAEEALALMNARKITALFVVDPGGAGGVAGVLHIHDCLRAGLG